MAVAAIVGLCWVAVAAASSDGGDASPAATTTTTALTTAASMPAGTDTIVESITDGDTLRVSGGERVRLIGIDTPELSGGVECFSREATDHLAELVPPGTAVRLVLDVEPLDRYGRTLAYLYRASDGLFVNLAMAAEGYPTQATFPPNIAHVDEFGAAVTTARDAGRGLWSACEEPGPTTTAVAAPMPSVANCDPAYPTVCIPPAPPDLDCGEVSYDHFAVLTPDPHGFDGADDDGIGCESG